MVLIKFDFVFIILTILHTIHFFIFIVLTILHVCHCERRIINGTEVSTEKSYMVYLVKANESDRRYDSWLCGGALVSRSFIITSAACVEDVQFMYAIAGYTKYVNDSELEKDACTKSLKKRVVFTCVPVAYEFDFDNIDKWAYIDIALVQVESPYEVKNSRYQIQCSYTPTTIPINYDLKRQNANLDAMVLGWGHSEIWRQHGDRGNYNQDYLRYGATILYDKNKCKEAYTHYPSLQKIIDKYMICSFEPGHLNDRGIPYSINQNNSRHGCITQQQKKMGQQGVLCNARKHMSLQEKDNTATNKDNGTTVNEADYIYKPGFGKIRGYYNRSFSRRNGICQNDHGGPLITWAGKREVLIGVASVFKITENKKCIGPFLYTSTVCNGAFLGCILGDRRANVLRGHNESVSPREALLCDEDPSVKGFDTIENYISWKDHPDGPAGNERQEQQNNYATIVQERSHSNPSKDEEPKDKFSLKIGPPLKRRPRIGKRPPAQQRPSDQQRPPAQQRPSDQQRPPAQQRPSDQQRPPAQQRPSDQQRPPAQQRPFDQQRPPAQQRPSDQQRPPAQQWHPLQDRLQPQQRPLLQIRPPLEQKPSKINTLPLRNRPPSKRDPQLLNRSPTEMNPPPEYEPPLEMNPPPEYAPPLEMNPPPEYAPPLEINPPPEYAPPLEINPPPEYAPPLEMNPPPEYAPPLEMNPPPEYVPPLEMNPPPEYAPPLEVNPPPEYEPPLEMNPPPEYAPQLEMNPPPIYAPLSEIKPPPIYGPPVEIWPPPEIDPLSNLRSEFDPLTKNGPTITTALLSNMEAPEFDEMLKSESNSYVGTEPEILTRPQRPLNS